MNNQLPFVIIQIVTFNSSRTIERCVDAALEEETISKIKAEILVIDNCSKDSTKKILQKYDRSLRLLFLNQNLGFCGGHNIGFNYAFRAGATAVLVLNPDTLIEPNTIESLYNNLKLDQWCGSVTPKLLRATKELTPIIPPKIDAAGMFLTNEGRHFDRGSEEDDFNQFNKPAYVFGATGAAVLYRTQFLKDLSHGKISQPKELARDEVFDENFFAYREDADLSLRAQWRGWRCRYDPRSIIYHSRAVTPEKRKKLAPIINYFGVRNRFLLQYKNFPFFSAISPLLALRLTLGTVIRNAIVIAAVLTLERTSIPALVQAIKLFPKSLKRRKAIFGNRLVAKSEVLNWFNRQSLPLKESLNIEESLNVIIVNYCATNHTQKAIEFAKLAIAKCKINKKISIIVVDNSPEKDQQLATIPDIIYHHAAENLGFGGAINFIADKLPGDLLILNPDIYLPDTALKKLVETLDRCPTLAAVAPLLVDEDLKPQFGFSVRRLPSAISTMIELFGLHRIFPNNPWTANYRMHDLQHFIAQRELASDNRPLLVEQPAGGCLLIRRAAFDQIGGFDESFYPAWYEDVDLCKRLLNEGWDIGLIYSLKVKHADGGGSSVKSLGKSKFTDYFYSNQIRYWEKHGNKIHRTLLVPLIRVASILRKVLTK
jgi:GT2 family glycosyltransferase